MLLAILSGVATRRVSAPANGRRPGGTRSRPAPGGPDRRVRPPPAAAGQETITLSGVGDVIMGTAPGNLPPNNGAGFFDPVKQALAADLVMGNLETPLSDDTGYSKCGNPPSDELLPVLRCRRATRTTCATPGSRC